MVHGPPTEWKKDASESFKTKLGLIMFVIYTAMYMAFVFLCVLDPKLMSMKVGNLNLAIAFGFFLIIIAVVLALIYNSLCSKHEKNIEAADNAKGKGDK